ncbi:hypothetical protein [Bradyrhizobium elkanii]|uniref:hypothetical protein n=1 Tax=Bradyrhizobium elkanii TaxID=29448 RepID=UPI001AEA5A86|nr:hypothetical protein [Bradyrhizobium elkanii]MBP2428844.1 hypothetical protein [Bradyrhizobium elkanii]WLA93607.1 hypothetical protein QNJ96_10165 [Bradyrhizobium elkanii]
MFAARVYFALASALTLSSCGTYVPDTQDFPGNQGDQQLLVAAVIKSIHCEVGNAIADLYDKAKKYPDMAPVTKALETWGMQLTLSLKTEEKGSLSPAVVWSPPSPSTALFSLAGGVSGAADAIRTDKVYFFYRVKDLKHYRYETGRRAGIVAADSEESEIPGLPFRHACPCWWQRCRSANQPERPAREKRTVLRSQLRDHDER